MSARRWMTTEFTRWWRNIPVMVPVGPDGRFQLHMVPELGPPTYEIRTWDWTDDRSRFWWYQAHRRLGWVR